MESFIKVPKGLRIFTKGYEYFIKLYKYFLTLENIQKRL